MELVQTDELKELIKSIQSLPDGLRHEVREKGLKEGGKIIKRHIEDNIRMRRHPHRKKSPSKLGESEIGWVDDLIDSGQLVDSIKVRKSGESSVFVYPAGGRNDGKTNDLVAIMLEYGSRKHPAYHIISDVAENSADEVADAIEQLLDAALEQLL